MKSRFQKHLSLLLALVLVVSLLPPATVSAAGDAIYYGRGLLAGMDNADALLYAYDQVVEGIQSMDATIPVYNGVDAISPTEFVMVMDLLLSDHTGLFWFSGSYTYSRNSETVLHLTPNYLFTGAALIEARTAFDAAAAEILAGVSGSMSEYEKELYIHDALAARITYTRNAANAHNAYGALVEGQAVCDGYSEALQYLLQQAGIQSTIVTGYSYNPSTGDQEGHAWNIVRIDGEYYHVDLTWDDQGEELYHAYFNLTDDMIQEDHIIVSSHVPACASQEAFYFHGQPTYLDSYTVESVAGLLKDNGYRVHVYIPGDVDAFTEWYWANAWDIAQAAGVQGGFTYGYSNLGHELIVKLTPSVMPEPEPEPEPEPDHEHSYTAVVTDPTCVDGGYTTHTCACGHSFVDSDTDPLGHNWDGGAVTTPATEENEGVRTYTCTRCGQTKTESIPKLDHIHQYNDYVNQPSCTEGGYTIHTCACGDSYMDSYTDPLGHQWDYPDSVHKTCARCGYTTVSDHIVDYGVCGDDLTWTLDDQGILTVSGTGAMYDYSSSQSPWAYTADSLTAIVIEPGVTYIGEEAFAAGEYVISVSIPNTVESIGSYAFAFCERLPSLEIPGSVRTIGYCAFGFCYSLTDLVISEGVETIDSFAFVDCLYLNAVTVPASVNQIGAGAFGSYYALTELPEILILNPQCVIEYDEYGDALGTPGTTVVHAHQGSTAHQYALNFGYTWKELGHIHRYTDVVTNPTCTEGGYTTHTCDCGESHVDSYTDPLGHDLNNGINLQDGCYTTNCSRCGQLTIPAVYGYPGSDLPLSEYEWGVLALTNTMRYYAGLAPVTAFASIQQACDIRAEEVSAYFSHTRPDGSSCFTVLSDLNIPCGYMGENIAQGHIDPQHVIKGWMNSAGHRENMLTPEFAHMGVGYYESSWVQLFTDGSGYSSFQLVVPENLTVETGTSLSSLGIYAVLTSSYYSDSYRACYLPILDVYCTGYDASTPGTQTVTVNVPGFTETFTITVNEAPEDPCANGHDMGAWVVITPATCTAKGMERRECVNCGHSETRDTGMIPHSYTDVVTQPTCEEGGYTTHTCACGDEYVDNYTDPLGHDMGAWTVTTAATCTAKGVERRECSRCDHYETRETDMIPHSYTDVVTAPTCEQDGYTTHTCACGHSYADSYTDALGHAWDGGVVTTPATEEAEGIRTYTCTRCDTTRTESIPRLDHEHSYTDAVVVPTCTEEGYTVYTCACGEQYVDNYTDPLGHDMGAWTVTTAATCTAKGVERRECSRCDHYETRETDMIPHSYTDVVTAPTCESEGFTTHTCACGDSYTDSVVPALGHDWDDPNAEYRTCSRCGTTTVPGNIIDYGVCGDNLTWTLDDQGTLTISGTGEMYDYESDDLVPWHEYKTGDNAITSIVIESGVTSIGGYAFYFCSDVTSVNIPSTVESIGDAAFMMCVSLPSIDIPGSVKTLKVGAFYGCFELTSVTIPLSVRSIGINAFSSTLYQDSDLKDIYILNPECTIGDDGYDTTLGDPTVTVVHSHRNDPAHQYALQYGYTWEELDHTHDYTSVVTAPTCVDGGYTTHTCVCGETYTDSVVPALGHDWDDPDADFRTCTRCGATEGTPPVGTGYRITLNKADTGEAKAFWIDGVEYPVTADGEWYHVDVETTGATNLVVYTFNDLNAADPHTQYPIGMKVWLLSFDGSGYTATYVPEFDNLLQYSGSSIRITGVKGIRMITSIDQSTKRALTGGGLAGYTLVEYGTALAWASDVTEGLVLGQAYTKSNYAYKKGVADPVFAYQGNLIQYTNVLVGFNNDQCIPDIAMRPYIILADGDGNQITLYGGVIYRNIGYIAYQNRNVFTPGSGSYNYVWDIIHHVYGDRYDEDFNG